MLVQRGRRTIEVQILTARESAVLVVRCWVHLLPRVVHDLLDVVCRERTVLAALLLPVMEERVVQRRDALGSVGRQQLYLLDGLRAAVAECLQQEIGVE